MIGLAQPVEIDRIGAGQQEPTGRPMSAPDKGRGGVAQQQRQPDNGESGETASRRPGSAGIESGSLLHPNPVIGIICAGDLAVHRDEIKAAISRGLVERPDAVWVCIEPKSDRITHDVMISLDIEPVVLPMVDVWRLRGDVPHTYDFRRTWRDLEMLHLCDELVIFHKRTGNSPWRDRAKTGLYDRKLFIVEVGPQPKAKGRKSRKPIGA